MNRQPRFDWKACFRPRQLLWFTIELLAGATLLLSIMIYVGDSLTRFWWIVPGILLPFYFATERLGKRWGFVDASPSRDRIGRR